MANTAPTKLGRYRQLAPRAAVHVSPLALGAMSFGDKHVGIGAPAMDKESAFKLLDTFFDAGGNHIDTANSYQDGNSERVIGEWAETRGYRDQLVIATKYTFPSDGADDTIKRKELLLGNNVKSMRLSLQASLVKLRTTYIDVFYVHFWDLHTSVEEMMDGLHNLVVAGKVLYLGISDSPAWLVVKANEYAKANGKTPFVIFQGAYSVLQRDLEREIIPMCKHEGIALALFRVVGGGRIRSDAEEERRRVTGENGRAIQYKAGGAMTPGSWERTESEKAMCTALEIIAAQVGVKHITAVAIAYALHKAPFVYPIIGGRNVEQLVANIEALDISLNEEQMSYIDGILPFEAGFPNNFIGEYGEYPAILARYSTFDSQPLLRPVGPAPK
ncbi:aryl-alcohol dehydrogenase [Mycena metata]|uniref:Aryl-alcohol dehydrogenase n=1 Tax=Mycena metata TaxID=1033252 RepID=A0AAD7JJL4_9AGAR|nr:aryl-alcohol dehydrogenase [Mycena metata]